MNFNMSPTEVKKTSFLEILRMLEEFGELNSTSDNEEKLPTGKQIF